MALFDPADFYKPLGTIAVVAGAATIGFVAGYALGRDPAAARKLLQFIARGVDRVTLAVAETREELGDLWAEARADVRAQWEEAQFAEVETGAAATAAAAVEPEGSEPPKKARRPRKTSGRRPARRPKAVVVH